MVTEPRREIRLDRGPCPRQGPDVSAEAVSRSSYSTGRRSLPIDCTPSLSFFLSPSPVRVSRTAQRVFGKSSHGTTTAPVSHAAEGYGRLQCSRSLCRNRRTSRLLLFFLLSASPLGLSSVMYTWSNPSPASTRTRDDLYTPNDHATAFAAPLALCLALVIQGQVDRRTARSSGLPTYQDLNGSLL